MDFNILYGEVANGIAPIRAIRVWEKGKWDGQFTFDENGRPVLGLWCDLVYRPFKFHRNAKGYQRHLRFELRHACGQMEIAVRTVLNMLSDKERASIICEEPSPVTEKPVRHHKASGHQHCWKWLDDEDLVSLDEAHSRKMYLRHTDEEVRHRYNQRGKNHNSRLTRMARERKGRKVICQMKTQAWVPELPHEALCKDFRFSDDQAFAIDEDGVFIPLD